MHRQLEAYPNPCISEREYVKLQYGRKIAQDTCLLASMKTPDWSQGSPVFIGRQNVIPCTVTTNSSSSNLKMYPYSVYSCACHSDDHRCHKYRVGCLRNRCSSGSMVNMFLPAVLSEANIFPHAGVRSELLEHTGRPVTQSFLMSAHSLMQHSVKQRRTSNDLRHNIYHQPMSLDLTTSFLEPHLKLQHVSSTHSRFELS